MKVLMEVKDLTPASFPAVKYIQSIFIDLYLLVYNYIS